MTLEGRLTADPQVLSIRSVSSRILYKPHYHV